MECERTRNARHPYCWYTAERWYSLIVADVGNIRWLLILRYIHRVYYNVDRSREIRGWRGRFSWKIDLKINLIETRLMMIALTMLHGAVLTETSIVSPKTS